MDIIALTKRLIKFNTINPPGNEEESVYFVGSLLEELGMRVDYAEFDNKRTNLIATYASNTTEPAICFSGHIDTVPLGTDSWLHDPFNGEIKDDKIFGRGSSDMKAGIASIIAAISDAIKGKAGKNLSFILTAGEEIGCQGAHFLKDSGRLPTDIGAMVIAEPTSNYPYIGHKGILWLKVITVGTTAHGSMPEKGDNAIKKLIEVYQKLVFFKFDNLDDPIFGSPTLNIGMIQGGQNINSVPDKAYFTLDIRTIKGQDHQEIISQLTHLFGDKARLEIVENVPSVFTEPENEWVKRVFEIASKKLKTSIKPSIITYGTDASYLKEGLNQVPTIILGPGEPEMAHKTDEYCLINKILEARDIYSKFIENWR